MYESGWSIHFDYNSSLDLLTSENNSIKLMVVSQY